MKHHISDFERGRNIVKVLVALAVAFSLIALMFTKENTSQNLYLILAALACIVGVVFVSLRFCRCPHCGKRILNGVLVLKVCPKCKRSLLTGAKVKK